MVCVSRAQKFTSLPHTIAGWYIRFVHENLKKTVCPTLLAIAEWYIRLVHKIYWKNMVCPTLLLNDIYIVVHEDLLIKMDCFILLIMCLTYMLLNIVLWEERLAIRREQERSRRNTWRKRNQVAVVTDIQITVAPPFETAKQLTVTHFHGKFVMGEWGQFVCMEYQLWSSFHYFRWPNLTSITKSL